MKENQSCLTMNRLGALSNADLQNMWDSLLYFNCFKTVHKGRLAVYCSQPSIFSYFYSIVKRADSQDRERAGRLRKTLAEGIVSYNETLQIYFSELTKSE